MLGPVLFVGADCCCCSCWPVPSAAGGPATLHCRKEDVSAVESTSSLADRAATAVGAQEPSWLSPGLADWWDLLLVVETTAAAAAAAEAGCRAAHHQQQQQFSWPCTAVVCR
jgi:hypothetical protein